MIQMLNMDCMEFLRRQPDKAYKLAICDPPYGIGEDGANNHTRGGLCKAKYYARKGWDNEAPPIEFFKELRRVSVNYIIFGANHFIDRVPIPSSCWIVWDKVNYGTDFADCELALTSFKTAVRQFTFQWNGMLQGDMKHKQQRIHPTEKPIALYKWLLKNYAKHGETILDTHGGSGSICIACHDLGFDLTWMELDKDYYAAAVERYQRHAAQLPLFKTIGGETA